MKLVIVAVLVIAIGWWRWPELTTSTFDLGRTAEAATDDDDEYDDDVIPSDDVRDARSRTGPSSRRIVVPTYDPWAGPPPFDPRAPVLPEDDPPALEAIVLEPPIRDALREVRAVLEECSVKLTPRPTEKFIVRLFVRTADDRDAGSNQTFSFTDELGRSVETPFESCAHAKLDVMSLPELPEAVQMIVRPVSN